MSVDALPPVPPALPVAKPRLTVLTLLATNIEIRMVFVILVVMLALSLASPYFFTVKNLLNVLDQSVIVGMVSLGETLVILIGGIDLSVGALVGVTGIVLGLRCVISGSPKASCSASVPGRWPG
jgi:ribose transport system permease protein